MSPLLVNICICLSLLIVAPLTAEARPSPRSIRDVGVQSKTQRILLQKEQAGKPQITYIRIEHPSGFSVEVPKEWERYVSGEDDGIRKFVDNAWVSYDGRSGKHTQLTYGSTPTAHPATLADARAHYEGYVKQPTTDFEFLHTSFLHDFSPIASEEIRVAGKPALSHTYRSVSASVHWQTKEIRIPSGNSIIVLSYDSDVGSFKKDMPVFEHFLASFRLNSTKSSSRTSRS